MSNQGYRNKLPHVKCEQKCLQTKWKMITYASLQINLITTYVCSTDTVFFRFLAKIKL